MKKFGESFGDAVFNIMTSGTNLRHELGLRSRIIFLNAVTLAGGFMIALFACLSYASGNYQLGAAGAVSAAVIFANFASLRLFRRWILGAIVDSAVMFVFYYYLVLSGGEGGSGVLWIMTYPLIVLFLLGPVPGSAVALAFLAAVSMALFMPSLNFAKFPILYSARVLGAYFFVWLFSCIYEVMRMHTLSKLQESNDGLAKVSAELGDEKQQTDNILHGVKEGIFLLDRECRIGETYSKYLETVFMKTGLSGTPLFEIIKSAIPERDINSVKDFFEILMSDRVNPSLLGEINPLSDAQCSFPDVDGSLTVKLLRFTFLRIGSLDTKYPVLGTVHDATDEFELKQKLDAEERDHRRSMESLFRIIHLDPAMTREFIIDTEAELDSVNENMREEGRTREQILEAAFQSAHSIKGNALLLGLEEFGRKVHEFEDVIKKLRDDGHEWRDLLTITLGLGRIKTDLDELKGLIEKIISFQSAMQDEGLAEATLFQYSMEKLMRKESERTGIPAVISFSGFGGKRGVPDEQRKLVKDVMVQFLRNSFAHGFETSEERIALGKPMAGTICIEAEWGDSSWTIRYRDDGRGLDSGKIREKAMKIPEYASTAGTMTPRDLAKLIFLPGFSTAGTVSLGAGRGVGMSFVKQRISDASGKLSARSVPGKSLEWCMTLPLTVRKGAIA